MNRLSSFIVCLFLLCSFFVVEVKGQEPTPPAQESSLQEVSNSKFRPAFLKALNSAVKAKDITRAEAIRLRVASLSPSFLAEAEKLAVIQMAFSGEDVPVLDDGKIDVAKIDWDALIEFIERLIPLILKLIDLFAMNESQLGDTSLVFAVLCPDYFIAV